jgi:DNA end-binding protein Ku
MHGREQLVLLRPAGDLLAMMTLQLDSEVTKPAAFADQAPKVPLAPEELEMMETLVETSTAKELDYAQFRDVYREKLGQLIEAKVAGKELVALPPQEHAHVINLMDALKQSVALAEGKQPVSPEPATAKKPAKKMAPSTTPGTASQGKRKRKQS